MAVNVYIVVTLVVCIVLAIVFAVLFAWEYTQQTKVINDLRFPEWKHVNHVFDYAESGQEEILLTCPADKNMVISYAVLQFYDPLDGLETSWNAETPETNYHKDSYWVSYGTVRNYPGNLNGKIGQCDFKQIIPGQLNEQCLNAKGDCTVRVNKNGSVDWGEPIPGENAVCSKDAVCMTNGGKCKFSLQVSYICDSEQSIQQIILNDEKIKTINSLEDI